MRLLVIALLLGACATPQVIKEAPPDGFGGTVRQTPLEAEEVRTIVANDIDRINNCYWRERLNTDTPASFTFELVVPKNGSTHTVSRIRISDDKQQILSQCIERVLKGLKFPAHVGDVLRVEIPIQPN